MTYPLEEQIKEAQREVGMRKSVYPKRITAGSMKQDEADRQIGLMEAIVVSLKSQIKDADGPDPMHNRCMSMYINWYQSQVDVPPKITSRDGKALKGILKYLRSVSKDKSDEGLVQSWEFLLNHYHLAGGFLFSQKGLTTIEKNLTEILDKIRNGASKADKRASEEDKKRELLRDASDNE